MQRPWELMQGFPEGTVCLQASEERGGGTEEVLQEEEPSLSPWWDAVRGFEELKAEKRSVADWARARDTPIRLQAPTRLWEATEALNSAGGGDRDLWGVNHDGGSQPEGRAREAKAVSTD